MKYLNKKLPRIKENINDGWFNMEEDDEKHILIENKRNVAVYLTEIMGAAAEKNMFMRGGWGW